MDRDISLATFTRDQLPLEEPWFDDRATERYLGGRGIAQTMVRAMVERPVLSGIGVFCAGVVPDNAASRRVLESTGFQLKSETADWEGIRDYLLIHSRKLLAQHPPCPPRREGEL